VPIDVSSPFFAVWPGQSQANGLCHAKTNGVAQLAEAGQQIETITPVLAFVLIAKSKFQFPCRFMRVQFPSPALVPKLHSKTDSNQKEVFFADSRLICRRSLMAKQNGFKTQDWN